MSKRVQLIRHATAVADAFQGLIGEITVDTTKKEIRLHDGITAGGVPVSRADLANVLAATISQDGKMTAAQVVELTAATADILVNAAAIAAIVADLPTTPGTVEASKLVQVDALKDIGQFNSVDIAASGLLLASVAVTKTAAQINDLMELAAAQTVSGKKTFTAGNFESADPIITGSISGNAFLDEDNMASNSAVKVSSQQAIKAYVDGKIGFTASTRDVLFTRTTATTGRTLINNAQLGTANATWALIELEAWQECISVNVSHQRRIRTRMYDAATLGNTSEVSFIELLLHIIGNVVRQKTQVLIPLDGSSDFWYECDVFNTGSGGGSSWQVDATLIGYLQ